MALAGHVFLWFAAFALMIPLGVLIAECLAALLPSRQRTVPGQRPSCAILIPAHNEEAGIDRTLKALQVQLLADDRLCVVADNCTDRTAEVARAHGALVFERHDAERRGKGYALDFGMKALDTDPPAVVVIVDADCVLSAGSVDALVREAAAFGRPTQAVYVLDEPPGGGARAQLSAFAFRFKNLVRPRGLDRLGLPCLLTGTGMAFPWAVLRDTATLASGHIVEDMQLGLDLSMAGYPPAPCAAALVTSELPGGEAAARTQRQRWEHGHLQTLLTQVPRLLARSLSTRNAALLGLALELSVPPLSMLFVVWGFAVVLLTAAAMLGASSWPALALGGVGAAALGAIFAAWLKFGRASLPLASILAVPFYILWKMPIYAAFLVNRQTAWIRTDRSRDLS